MDSSLKLMIRTRKIKERETDRERDVNGDFQNVQIVKHLLCLCSFGQKTPSNNISFIIILTDGLSLHVIIFIKHQSESKRLKKDNPKPCQFSRGSKG